MKNVNPVVWFEIYVDDLDRAKKFYETVFQLELNEMPMPASADDSMKMLFFPANMESKNSASGALVKMDGFKAGNNSTIVYFMSEDCSVEESRVKAAGGKVFKSKVSLGDYGAMVLACDTEGNMIGIHSMK
ncbi:VOC family protein [Arenibacter algicola]|jgi:predicted enzyme related to lactoylglutathione lyase|uniref:Glyoxalase n=1 Tax=Arenibacter algicola TaxID=616991 RepID=A0A221V1Z7_9FLAO|nr:VOC family protein [Arenibacter algicola]ASO07161.1 glyoxalase [Arenibacter algicola]|tara:strand:- start:1621 stop:2013 length:393 start_codon:yes stop_codon:yes gene_type:complete